MTHEHGITATPPHTHSFSFFFFNDTATTEIYTLSLHDALPIWQKSWLVPAVWMAADPGQVPTLDQLFGAAMQLFRDRLARRAALDKGMTAQEVAALLNRQEVCAYYFLGARAFGEVLDEAMAARTQRQVRP